MRVPSAALAVLVIVAAFAACIPRVGAQPVFGDLRGPAALSPGQVALYNLTIVGGPSGPGVNYTLSYYLTGPDPTGGAPVEATPGVLTGNETLLRVNITAPPKEQTVTLVVRITAQKGSLVEDGSVEKSIAVVTPIVLSARFQNPSPTAALNVSVRFYVDNVLVGTQTVARIDANGEGTATLSYLPVNLAFGSHAVRVEADLDRNGVIDAARGEVVVDELFIRESPPLSTGWLLVLGIGAFVPVFFVAVALRRRNRP